MIGLACDMFISSIKYVAGLILLSGGECGGLCVLVSPPDLSVDRPTICVIANHRSSILNRKILRCLNCDFAVLQVGALVVVFINIFILIGFLYIFGTLTCIFE